MNKKTSARAIKSALGARFETLSDGAKATSHNKTPSVERTHGVLNIFRRNEKRKINWSINFPVGSASLDCWRDSSRLGELMLSGVLNVISGQRVS